MKIKLIQFNQILKYPYFNLMQIELVPEFVVGTLDWVNPWTI